jgi:hypothetical protein
MPVEAEVVLDLRFRAGLTAGGVRLSTRTSSPSLAAAPRPRAGRPRADHHHIADRAAGDPGVEAQALGDLGVARRPEDLGAPADEHRDVLGADIEAVDQDPRALILLHVEVRVGVPVALEELPDPLRPGAVV